MRIGFLDRKLEMTQMATLENLSAGEPEAEVENPKASALCGFLADGCQIMQDTVLEERKTTGVISVISEAGGEIALDLVDLGNELNEILVTTNNQTVLFDDLAQTTSDLSLRAKDLSSDTEALMGVTELVANEMTLSKESASITCQEIANLSEWVTVADSRLNTLKGTISSINAIAQSIDSIAQQTHILALNARIEAARSGVAGDGFEVIAQSVRSLSDKTISAAHSISETTEPLIQAVSAIGRSSVLAKQRATRAEGSSSRILAYIETTQQQVDELSERIVGIDSFVQNSSRLSSMREVAFDSLRDGFSDSRNGLQKCTHELSELVSLAEWLLIEAAISGSNSFDQEISMLAISLADRISNEIESLIDDGTISKEDLFDRSILGSGFPIRPESLLGETKNGNSVFSKIQGLLLQYQSISYIIVTDKGSLSRPQGTSRRHYAAEGSKEPTGGTDGADLGQDEDRIADGALRSTRPFCIQTFRRTTKHSDRPISMKDLSAPIFIRGEHWGAIRIGIASSAEVPKSNTSQLRNEPDAGGATKHNIDFDGVVDKIAKASSELGLRLAEVAAEVASITSTSTLQLSLFEELEGNTAQAAESNRLLYSDAQALVEATLKVEEQMRAATKASDASRDDVLALVTWIESAEEELDELNTAISRVSSFASSIDSIAQQTHVLALNARVEAARVGNHGRSFAVIADAVRDLSDETIKAANKIKQTLLPLAKSIEEMRESAIGAKESAAQTLRSSGRITSAVAQVNGQLEELAKRIRHVNGFIISANELSEVAETGYVGLSNGFRSICDRLKNTAGGVENLVKVSEWLLGQVVESGAITQDKEMVDILQAKVSEVSRAYEVALRDGRVKEFELFDTNYLEVPGTNPKQYLSKFTYISEEILPEIIDSPLKDSAVDYLIIHDNDGYLPIHNKKSSQPQGPDPVWNNEHSRHRRIYSDKVAKKAAESRAQFVIQIYRRDLGGGHYSLIKDVSAPLYIEGKKWGCVRLGYSVKSE